MEKINIFNFKVKGDFKKKNIKHICGRPWDLKNFLFSQQVAFRERDKKVMRIGFNLWWKDVIKTYGKSKWIEVIMFTRPEN